MPAWSEGLEDMGARSTFRGRHFPWPAPLGKARELSWASPSEQQHAGSPGLPGRGRDAEGSRAAVNPAARGGAHGGTGILFKQQVGEIHTAFNQAASFRL